MAKGGEPDQSSEPDQSTEPGQSSEPTAASIPSPSSPGNGHEKPTASAEGAARRRETADLIGDDHVSTSTLTPLRPDAFVMSDDEKIAAIEPLFGQIMDILGLDRSDESLSGTPHRVAKMYVSEIFRGLNPANRRDDEAFGAGAPLRGAAAAAQAELDALHAAGDRKFGRRR